MIAADARRHDIAVGLRGRQFHVDGFLACLYRRNQVGQGQVGIGTCHQVHMMVGNKVFLHPLGHTAQHAHNEPAMLLPHRVEELQAVQNLLLGIIAHRTSIQKHGIGLVQRLGHRISGHFHNRRNQFTVCHIHLAAVRFDEQFLIVTGSCRF